MPVFGIEDIPVVVQAEQFNEVDNFPVFLVNLIMSYFNFVEMCAVEIFLDRKII